MITPVVDIQQNETEIMIEVLAKYIQVRFSLI